MCKEDWCAPQEGWYASQEGWCAPNEGWCAPQVGWCVPHKGVPHVQVWASCGQMEDWANHTITLGNFTVRCQEGREQGARQEQKTSVFKLSKL